MGKYVVSADEYYYIHKVVLLCNEFYDDLMGVNKIPKSASEG